MYITHAPYFNGGYTASQCVHNKIMYGYYRYFVVIINKLQRFSSRFILDADLCVGVI